MIAHPPCSYLANINEWMQNHIRNPKFWDGFDQGVSLFKACQQANAPRVAVDNPQPASFTKARVGKPDQLV